jgi:RNA 3'-terminal phosphate cyclase (ATP)
MKTQPIIQLDGGEGGGQMLRTALSLAMVTGKPFRMTNIRGKRRKPGLMRQHLTCVKAACEISGGVADGAEPGSTELVFRAGKVNPGSYQFAIGTAGSTGLLLQTLLPALWLAGGPSTLRLTGGTHNPLAPPFDFLDRAFLPAMARMGARAELRLLETGFAPAGGGIIECRIEPTPAFTPFHLTDHGPLLSSRIRVPFRNLPHSIADRVLAAAKAVFPSEDAAVIALPAGPGQGVACLVEAEFEHSSEMACAFGEMNVSSEKVGRRAGKMIHDFIHTGAAVGRNLADQILLPIALAGEGSFTTMNPDDHIPTNISVIEAFLPSRFQVTRLDGGIWSVSCGPK